MVTGDNIATATTIAKECGLLTENGLAMEGPAFRKLTPDQVSPFPTYHVTLHYSPLYLQALL
jgi:P-type Ca2+ transporter type 2C